MRFPAEKRDAPTRQDGRSPELQEKLDIHRMLFDRAWAVDDHRKRRD
jgi:hypothetical protein